MEKTIYCYINGKYVDNDYNCYQILQQKYSSNTYYVKVLYFCIVLFCLVLFGFLCKLFFSIERKLEAKNNFIKYLENKSKDEKELVSTYRKWWLEETELTAEKSDIILQKQDEINFLSRIFYKTYIQL